MTWSSRSLHRRRSVGANFRRESTIKDVRLVDEDGSKVAGVTYSIVARDAETGELGVAVQSRAFGTGAVCPWVLPGVGAATTQSFTEISYGPRGLELLASGRSPR